MLHSTILGRALLGLGRLHCKLAPEDCDLELFAEREGTGGRGGVRD